jgi:hypothetical protein
MLSRWSLIFVPRDTLTQPSPTAVGLIAAFCGIAYWMSLELLVLVYVTFKKRTGLYFWSIIITTIGILLQTTGYLLKVFENTCPPIFVTIICKVGWVSNVTGFSVVLWSRLHLVVHDPRILRFVLIMIIVNAVVLHVPIVVFEFGLMSVHRDLFLYPMEVMERIQQTIFTCQETVISGLYIYYTARFLDVGIAKRTRKVVALLIAVQVLVVSLDAGLTAFDYMNMFTLKCTLHPFVYSVKLKLEFIVLNQLLTIAKRGLAPGLRQGNFNDRLDLSSSEDSRPSRTSPISRPPGAVVDGKRSGTSSVDFITRAPVVSVESKATTAPAHPSAVTVTQELSVHSSNASGSLTRAEVGDDIDEHNLRDVVGRPDEDGANTDSSSIDDIERQYLGSYVA